MEFSVVRVPGQPFCLPLYGCLVVEKHAALKKTALETGPAAKTLQQLQ